MSGGLGSSIEMLNLRRRNDSRVACERNCARNNAGDRGEGDLSKIEILGPAIKDHAKTYQLPKNWDQITSWQKPIVTG